MPPGEVDGAMAECQRVEPEHVFVIGDNDPFSADSREFGQIPEAAIVGRVVISIGTNGVTLP
jgi:type IV secretory pathway protease TraF